MNPKTQTFFLIILILISLSLTKIRTNMPLENPSGNISNFEKIDHAGSPSLSYQKASLVNAGFEVPKTPSRNWNVLDPVTNSEAVLIQSLDDNSPLFYFNTYKNWPIASLTKILTSLVVLEEIGENKKIPIDQNAVMTEGVAGGLKTGEVYTAQDLLKIMLLSSSNDAATAFENFLTKPEMVRLLNQKARGLGMTETVIHDASGLSDLNESTASDILKLAFYVLEKEPDIFNWTRNEKVLVQPINDVTSQTVYNINPLVKRADFLGGKTGTSPEAKENLVSVLTLNNKKLILIILGSRDRVKEVDSLLDWINRAYNF